MMTCTPMTDAELAHLGTRDDAGFGSLETARGHLPLTAMAVEARVTGLVAEVELAQTFENTLAEPIEATYIFPLPDRAAVTRFRMEVAGRVIDGVIEERGRAREQYEEAIAAGHRAAITEEDRAGVFTMRVGNLAPGDVAVVRLTMVGPLPLDEGEVTFRFPLVVAPRYIPGKALPRPHAGLGTEPDTDATPDASRITPPVMLPGCPNPVRLSIAVAIDGMGAPVGDVKSSLHAISEEVKGGARAIRLQAGEKLDRDFILRWGLGDAEVRTGAVAVRDPDGDGGTVIVTLVPPRDEAPARPRDVVFVLDRSGSMGGWKMVAARRACARMIDTLGEKDRFAVLAFDNSIEMPPGQGFVPGTDRNRFRAVEFLAGVDARGGTEMREPLVKAAEMLAGGYEDRDRVLVLLTDGQVGNEDQILRELAGRVKNVRVFTLGVDQAVNAAFLRRLAAAGGGACELVESEDRLDAVMAKVHRRIATPVVTEIALSGDVSELAPSRIPALFAGAPVVLAARTSAIGGTIVVTGHTPSGQRWEQRIAVREAKGDAAAAMWARARIRDLEDRYAIGDHSVEAEIVRVSLKHRVLSRFTAFVAIDRAEKIARGGNPRQVVQPVEMPAGWAGAAAAAAPALAKMKSVMMGGMAPPSAQAAPPMDIRGMPPGAPMAPPSFGAPPSPPPAPRGFMERARELVRGRKVAMPSPAESEAAAKKDEAEPTVDTAPYLKRAKDLADAIDRAADKSDRRALDLALARLVELVEDVRSVGGLDELAAALDRVATALRAALAGAPDQWRAPAKELRDVASARKSGGRAFWK